MLAFFLATQLNFTLSYLFTWASRRRSVPHASRAILRRALAFNLTACVTLAVNALAFSSLHFGAALPPLGSALGAVAVSMLFSYTTSSRLVFRYRTPRARVRRPPRPAPSRGAGHTEAPKTVELIPRPRLSLVGEHGRLTPATASEPRPPARRCGRSPTAPRSPRRAVSASA